MGITGKKKVFAWVLALALAAVIGGCSAGDAPEPAAESPSGAADEASLSADGDSEEEGGEEESGEEESGEESSARTVRDSEGDDIEVPDEITKAAPVIGAFSQMTAMLTSGESKIVAAATSNISEYFKHVFPGYLETNPNSYDATSVEDLIASGAQVAYGPGSLFSDEQRAQLEQAGIPFVTINNIRDVDGMCESFGIIGEILGEKESAKAQQFIEYYRGNIAEARTLTKDIPDEEKVRFMNLRFSADVYSTINKSDICNEYIEAAGGINVAADYTEMTDNVLMVDAELIVQWNPQVIMTSDQTMVEQILADPALATVEAVAKEQVYVCPYGIYMWSVRSGEGAMLPLWLGAKMYPELFAEIDMDEVVTDFFREYYSYDLPADELESILSGIRIGE